MEDTIFSYIDSVLFNKQKVNSINESESGFNNYMVNRWCSMYSSDISKVINQTSNRYSKVFVTKQEVYDLLFHILPKKKKRKINYLKKSKEQKTEEKEDITYISNNLEISKREVNQYIDLLEQFSK